jgi:REP element-mobilizing transposase RayT
LRGNAYRFHLHAAVVMPEHVHLLLTPLRDENGWPYGLPAILKSLKGASARAVNKLLATSGPVWQEGLSTTCCGHKRAGKKSLSTFGKIPSDAI